MIKRLINACLLIMMIQFPVSCASRDPVELVTFSIYGNQFTNIYEFLMHVDFINRTADKTVEQAELTVKGIFRNNEEETETAFRLFETEGVQSDEHNHEHEHQTDVFKDNETYTAYISKAYFTDGSVWENTDQSGKISASVWGANTNESSPLRLLEANFYRQYEGASDIEFNIDYINTSADSAIKAAVFEIVPKTADGSVCQKTDGTDHIIFYPVIPDVSVAPGSDNSQYHYTIPFRGTADLSSAVIFEIRAIRTVTEDGRIYSSSEAEPLRCVMLGKKGYDFSTKCNLKSVNRLIKDLKQRFNDYGMDEGDPLVYIRDHEYCVLRYKDADIRAELDESNELKTDAVSFSACFSRDDYLDLEKTETSTQMIDNLFRIIFCTVLDEAPYDQMLAAVNDYLENDSSYIVLNDQSLYVTEDGGLIYGENSELLINIIAGTGSGLTYDPSIKMLWAKNTIY